MSITDNTHFVDDTQAEGSRFTEDEKRVLASIVLGVYHREGVTLLTAIRSVVEDWLTGYGFYLMSFTADDYARFDPEPLILELEDWIDSRDPGSF